MMILQSIKENIGTPCNIMHTKSGLYFNGYDEYYESTKGKNTLSENYSKKFMSMNQNDQDILDRVFKNQITIRNDGKKYIKNIIVHSGSEIHKILSKYYRKYEYLPLSDFHIERI